MSAQDARWPAGRLDPSIRAQAMRARAELASSEATPGMSGMSEKGFKLNASVK